MPTNSVFNPHDDQAVEARIKAFNQSLQQKQGEPMTVNEAVWNIEAALNYNYCHVELPQGETFVDSLILELPVDNDKIEFCNVENAYQQAEAKLKHILKKDYHAIVIDVEPLQTSDVFKTKITFILGDAVVKKSVSFPNSFGTDDYWRCGFGYGKCDGTFYLVKDATTEIQYWLNSNFNYIPGQYFTDIEHQFVEPNENTNAYLNPNDAIPNDNYLDYLLFINRKFDLSGNLLPNFYELPPYYCISPEEMNFYTWNYRAIAINTPSQGGVRPPNKNVIHYWVQALPLFYIDPQTGCMRRKTNYHQLTVEYGILHTSSTN